MQELLNKLNLQQRQAVQVVDKPVLVLAGAGSGKTRVITHKIAYLIQVCKIKPKHIIAITFTNKAAKEMQERTGQLLRGMSIRGLTICTFHALGLKILRKEAPNLGYKTNFSVFDSYDCSKIIAEISQTTDIKVIRQLQQQISLWKNQLISPEQADLIPANKSLTLEQQAAELEYLKLASQIYRQYQDTLFTYQAVDFDDLIKLPVELLTNNYNVLYKWRLQTRYLLIDEYQDTNSCQYQLVKLLAGEQGAFTAVGDDDQAIYAWRGANSDNLRLLSTDYPQLQLIKLEQNYRSTQTILVAANQVISHNPKLFDKRLWSEFGKGEPIKIISCKSNKEEADKIASKILFHHNRQQGRWSDYAILYRSNYQSRVLEEVLREYKIPYLVAGGESWFDKPELRDIMAYLRLVLNEDDDSAFIRAVTTPKRSIGEKTLAKLSNYAKQRNISLFEAMFESGFAYACSNASTIEKFDYTNQVEGLLTFGKFINKIQDLQASMLAGELLHQLLQAINYQAYLYENEEADKAEKRYANVENFVAWAMRKSEAEQLTLAELTQKINLITMLDSNNDEEVDAIQLTTLHAAKGLEYPYVYLIGCEEGILPHKDALDIEEERRLMYVGITRARYELTLSYCNQRRMLSYNEGNDNQVNNQTIAGRTIASQECEPSRFIAEMGKENIIGAEAYTQEVSPEQTLKELALLKQLLQR
ncbi:MAG: ATP-dependent helicase Rep [Pseudomonadota bacterium]|jgi:ATP-dependent DNA helicase Rep